MSVDLQEIAPDFTNAVNSFDNQKIRDTLRHVNSLLVHSASGQQQQIKEQLLNSLPLELLFGLFELYEGEDSDSDLNESVFSTLTKLFQCNRGLDIIKSDKFAGYLNSCYKSKRNLLSKKLAIQLLSKLTETSEGTQFLLSKSDYVSQILNALCDSEISLAKDAHIALVKIVKSDVNAARVLLETEQNNGVLKELVAKNATLQIRVFDLIADISTASPEAFRACEASGLLEELIAQVQQQSIATHSAAANSNPLTLLNLLEIVVKILGSDSGVEYLDSRGLLKALFAAPESNLISCTPENELISTFVMDMLDSVAKKGERVFEKLDPARVLQNVINNLDANSLKLREVAITTIGSLCGSVVFAASYLLADPAERANKYLDHMTSGATVLKMAFLHSMAAAFESTTVPSELLGQLYAQLVTWLVEAPGRRATSPMAVLIDHLRAPFADVRFAAFHFIQALSIHDWGLRAIADYPAMPKYLLDRNTEITKEGKEWKYAIIKQIVATDDRLTSRSEERILTPQDSIDLRTYLRLGAFFQKSEAAVAVASKRM